MSEQITQVRALHASEREQYHLLMENVKDYAIFLLDPGGRIASWNSGAERILGYREAEIVGQHFSCIFTPADIEKSEPAQELKRAAEGGRSDDERWHVRKDGSRLWSSGVVTALRDDAGKLRGFAKIMRDVTERKQTMEELAESSRRKDEFLAMLGHELRNPLSPILNAVFLIERDPHANAGQRQAAQMIERQTRKIVRLVDDLLDISRITRGKIQLRKECIRL